MVNLARRLGYLWRNGVYMRLQGGQEIRVQRRDKIVVVLLLVLGLEGIPGEVVNVPCVLQLYVWEAQSNGAV